MSHADNRVKPHRRSRRVGEARRRSATYSLRTGLAQPVSGLPSPQSAGRRVRSRVLKLVAAVLATLAVTSAAVVAAPSHGPAGDPPVATPALNASPLFADAVSRAAREKAARDQRRDTFQEKEA